MANLSTVIEDILARKVFNSRGEETLEVDIVTAMGFGRATAPAGASVGKAEVPSYPPGGVDQAIKTVAELITPELIGTNADMQEEIDLLLHDIDGTTNFANVGGNVAYVISLASAEAAATSYGVPLFQHLAGYLATQLPYPLGNVLGGGKHARGKAIDIQELLVLPLQAPDFTQAAKANTIVHQQVGSLLKEKDTTFTGGRNDEGAWIISMKDEEALEILAGACEAVSEEVGIDCRGGVDMAASALWNSEEKCYVYRGGELKRSPAEQLDFVLDILKTYNLAYIEDPFHEEDFESFAELQEKAKECLVCGDDLFATNRERLARGIDVSAGNALIVKVNQIGTLTDAWETTKMAKEAGYVPVMSHRSGETNDAHIAHLAVAFGCPVIKTGVVGGSRVSKINELIRIEETLGDRAEMHGLCI
jgi:enolase